MNYKPKQSHCGKRCGGFWLDEMILLKALVRGVHGSSNVVVQQESDQHTKSDGDTLLTLIYPNTY